MKIAVKEIIVANRLRAVNETALAGLAESMESQGQLQPIIVRTRPSGGYRLVAGLHRVEAAKKLKWPEIEAKVVKEMEVDEALLAEIDENLMRADLEVADRITYTGKRAEVYERIHGNPKAKGAHEANKKLGHKVDTNDKLADAFSTDTAKKTGRSERKVQRDVKRAKDSKGWLKEVRGTSLSKGDEIDALIEMPRKERDTVIKKAKTGEKVSAKSELKKFKRNQREAELATKQKAFPKEQFGVIVADPPWDHETWSDKGKSRHASNHYPTQAKEIIKSLPVHKIAANDCVLWLWTTTPHLRIALDVMEKWGFEYKSNYVWVKNRFGTGYWNRSKHEILLIGTKGKIPAPAEPKSSVIEAPVGKHSAKPEEFLKMIERYFPKLPKIELHRRGPARKGWEAWGNETTESATK